MSDFDYQISDNYEEAVARKAEVLKKINEYNEALLLEKELPCTEEEIEALQEEYQILNDHLALTEEERIKKLKESDVIVQEDGTIVEKVTIWDKIHWSVYLYAFISTIFASGIITKLVGNSCMNSFMDKYFEKVFDAGIGMYELGSSEMLMGPFEFWFKFFLSYLWLPLLIIILSTVIYILFRKRNDINTKITKWLLILHVVLSIIVVTVIMLAGEFKTWNAYYNNLEIAYMGYYYSLTGGYY